MCCGGLVRSGAEDAEQSRGQLMDLTALKFKCLQRSVLCRGGCTRNYCHGF